MNVVFTNGNERMLLTPPLKEVLLKNYYKRPAGDAAVAFSLHSFCIDDCI